MATWEEDIPRASVYECSPCSDPASEVSPRVLPVIVQYVPKPFAPREMGRDSYSSWHDDISNGRAGDSVEKHGLGQINTPAFADQWHLHGIQTSIFVGLLSMVGPGLTPTGMPCIASQIAFVLFSSGVIFSIPANHIVTDLILQAGLLCLAWTTQSLTVFAVILTVVCVARLWRLVLRIHDSMRESWHTFLSLV